MTATLIRSGEGELVPEEGSKVRVPNPYVQPSRVTDLKKHFLGHVSIWAEAIRLQHKRAAAAPTAGGREYAIDLAFLVMTARRLRDVGERAARALGLSRQPLDDFDAAQPSLNGMRVILEHAVPARSNSPTGEGLQFHWRKIVDVKPDRTVETVVDAHSCAIDALKLAAALEAAIKALP